MPACLPHRRDFVDADADVGPSHRPLPKRFPSAVPRRLQQARWARPRATQLIGPDADRIPLSRPCYAVLKLMLAPWGIVFLLDALRASWKTIRSAKCPSNKFGAWTRAVPKMSWSSDQGSGSDDITP